MNGDTDNPTFRITLPLVGVDEPPWMIGGRPRPIGNGRFEWQVNGTRTKLEPQFFAQDLLAVDLHDDDALVEFLAMSSLGFAPVDAEYWPTNPCPDAAIGALRGATYQDFPLEAPRWSLLRARAATLHLAAADAGESVLEPWRELGMRFDTQRLAWRWMAAMINAGLAGVPLHLVLLDSEDQRVPVDLEDEREVDLFTALCIQIASAAAGDELLRRCARPDCATLFLRQTGRAQHGQHRRSGVAYCSALCARRQAGRAYRERERQKRDRS